MVLMRYVTGTVWSLAAAVAGTWVAVSPWALGEQVTGAPWSATTTSLVGSGGALVVLGLWGCALVLGTLTADLRAVGLLPTGRRLAHEQRTEPAQPREQEVLTHLARAVAAELTRHRPRGVPERPDGEQFQGRRGGLRND